MDHPGSGGSILRARRTPATKCPSFVIPRHRVCQPGIPSLFRFRWPPRWPTAKATSPTVTTPLPVASRSTAHSSSLSPAADAGASAAIRAHSFRLSRRTATTLITATAAYNRLADSNCRRSAPIPVFNAL
jgi:hypothetical protein